MDLQTRIYEASPPSVQTALLNVRAAQIHWHRYGSPYDAAVAFLQQSDTWSELELRNYQDAQLRKIVAAAYAGSPYYRSVFDKLELHPADITTVEDLALLPVLTKSEVKANFGRLLTSSSPPRAWLEGHTSGTTGSPLSIWYDRDTCIMTNAIDRRQKIWAGMKRADWLGLFLGRTIVPVSQDRGAFWRTNWIQRQIWFSSFHMSPSNLDAYIAEIQRRKLQYLEGYPSTLYVLAKHVVSRGTTLPMKAAISSSETLHPIQRATIEEAFACRLFDFYAQAERVIYAGECSYHTGKHVSEEYGYLEIVDGTGAPVSDGELGFVVGTSLHNTAMPMIRYQTGDVSAIIPSMCGCGRAHRRLQDVTTKAEDIVVTPDGRLISPSVLTHPFKPFDSIKKSQIIQASANEIVVKLVASSDFSPELQRRLLERLRERLGTQMRIRLEFVADIPPEPSGKYRWVISHIDTPYDFEWE